MKVNYIPEGHHTITPYLQVADAARLVKFLQQAFGAIERARITRPDGGIMHAQVLIGDSLLMIGESPGITPPRTAMLYMYVPDVDMTYQQALAAGAKSMVEPADMFYGDRHACVKDASDNEWWIATHVEDLSLADLQARATQFHNKMAAKKS